MLIFFSIFQIIQSSLRLFTYYPLRLWKGGVAWRDLHKQRTSLNFYLILMLVYIFISKLVEMVTLWLLNQ